MKSLYFSEKFSIFCFLIYNFAVTPETLADVGRKAVENILIVSAPFLALSLIVGLVISLFQALTQIQEMTLTFIPKIIAIFVGAIVFGSFMAGVLLDFTKDILEKIPLWLGVVR